MADAITDMWRSVLLFVPKAVAFVAIMVIGYFVAKGVRKVVNKVLERVGFDRAVERGGIGRVLERTRYDASDILAKLVYYAVLLLTLQLAFGVWGPNPISDLISSVVAWLPRAFVAIVIVVVAAAIAGAVRDLIRAALGGLSYGRIIATFAWAFIVGLGVIAALNQAGIATTVTTPVLIAVLATIAGILIVGVGGGLVRPMQSRWDGWLTRAATETEIIKTKAREYAAEVEARAEAERLARAETERLEAERQARLAAEETERLEAERLETERLEVERLETERAEAERVEAERVEAERLDAERAEAERVEAERVEAERAEAERVEAERLESERAAAEEAGRDDVNRTMSDRTAVIPRQEDNTIPISGGPAAGTSDAEATQVINSGRGLYQSGSVAPSGKLAPMASESPDEPASFQPGRAGNGDLAAPAANSPTPAPSSATPAPDSAEPTQVVPRPDAVDTDKRKD